MSESDRRFMLAELARAGIFLDETPVPLTVTTAAPTVPVVDRDFVREALVRAGAPARDLDWLVASCPSELDAIEYRAPLPEAFCAVHDGPQPTDEYGCVLCRSIDLPNPPPESPTKDRR